MAANSQDRPLARAGVLAAGAALVYVLFDREGIDFGLVPLVVGLVYLAAAVAGGLGGALWAPGLVVTGWGLGNDALTWDGVRGQGIPESAAHMVGIGLGILALAALARFGVQVSVASVGLAVLLSGLLFTAQRAGGYGILNEGVGYAVLLLVFAALELVTHVVRRRR